MKIKCLGCGHGIEMDETYEEYEGEFKCAICWAVLAMKFQEGKLKGLKLNKPPSKGLEE